MIDSCGECQSVMIYFTCPVVKTGERLCRRSSPQGELSVITHDFYLVWSDKHFALRALPSKMISNNVPAPR